jgi:peptidoglycan LD-endopeptidase LytH
MSRVGWVMLVGILLVAGLFALTVRISDPAPPRVAAAQVPKPRLVDAGLLNIPVANVTRAQIADSWGDPRSGGRGHKGLDIMAPGGTPVLAAAGGTIEKLFQSRQGGTTIYQRSADGRWTFYYAHLASYAPGVREGLKVLPGQLLGFVGDTGNSGAGNYHLHFSITRRQPGERWWQGEEVNPFPYLNGSAKLP